MHDRRPTLLAAALLAVAAVCGCGSSVDGSNGGGGSGGGALPAGACRSNADCDPNSEWCAPPGTPGDCGVGITSEDACATDDDCKAKGNGYVCVPQLDICAPSMSTCEPGCAADADCREGETCDAAHHCSSKACAAATDCPANFLCGSDTRCARKGCSTDADCAGHCVGGACYGDFGECTGTVG